MSIANRTQFASVRYLRGRQKAQTSAERVKALLGSAHFAESSIVAAVDRSEAAAGSLIEALRSKLTDSKPKDHI